MDFCTKHAIYFKRLIYAALKIYDATLFSAFVVRYKEVNCMLLHLGHILDAGIIIVSLMHRFLSGKINFFHEIFRHLSLLILPCLQVSTPDYRNNLDETRFVDLYHILSSNFYFGLV